MRALETNFERRDPIIFRRWRNCQSEPANLAGWSRGGAGRKDDDRIAAYVEAGFAMSSGCRLGNLRTLRITSPAACQTLRRIVRW
jgi:hypothetical protein